MSLKPEEQKYSYIEENGVPPVEETGGSKLLRGLLKETDDPSEPSLTFRVLLIGGSGAILLGITNTILQFRTNTFTIPPSVVTLLGYPIGVLMAKTLPKGILNPGPFTIKEHALLTVLASGAGGIAYGVDNVVIQKMPDLIGDPHVTFWNSLAFVMATQLIGFGLAGMTRRFLVKPVEMLWPASLSTIAMLNSFHEGSGSNNSRFRMFLFAALFMFCYQWIPSYFLPVLAGIALCFPGSSKTWRNYASFTTNAGPGIGAISLDWSVISNMSPMVAPWWALVNMILGNMIWNWVITPIVIATNPFHSPPLQANIHFADGTPVYPVNSRYLYTNNGSITNGALLMDRNNSFNLNVDYYNKNGPIYLSPFFALSYLVSYLSLSASIAQVMLWYGPDIWRQFKNMISSVKETSNDIHGRLMEAYWDIPEWMYLAFLGVFMVVQLLIGLFTPYSLPWWGTPFAILINLFFLIPFGIIVAISGTRLGLNVISEFLIGLIIPGETIAVVTFKSLTYNTLVQALDLSSDLKMGHYMHINPVHMVLCQLLGTMIGAITNTWAAFYVMNSGFLEGKSDDWGYSGFKTFYAASAIWGAVAPQRFFGIGSPYGTTLLGFLIGFILPFIPFYLNKFYPWKIWKLINFALLSSMISVNVGDQTYLITPLLVGWFSQFYLLRYHPDIFAKYNYVVSAAFDVGSGFGAILLGILDPVLPKLPAWAMNPTTRKDYYCFDMSYQ